MFTYIPPHLVLASDLSSACSVSCFSIFCSDIFVSLGCLSAAYVTILNNAEGTAGPSSLDSGLLYIYECEPEKAGK